MVLDLLRGSANRAVMNRFLESRCKIDITASNSDEELETLRTTLASGLD
jgi:hypothetical protein